MINVLGRNAENHEKFGSDRHLPAEGSEGFSHKLFVGERAIDLSGVKKCNAAIDGSPKQGGRLLHVFRRAGKAHAHMLH
ncbi:hypothetical protein A4S05_26480 [Nostoc sp. KVJ20]|nr:hypothetical protein A4S05_26480 [Nostoc sp. KVJ20]